ncbi:MAG: radical SAM protein [Candidatus Aenigmatarchaeota archaeon]
MFGFKELYAYYRFFKVKYLKDRKPFACSLAPTAQCNLKCPGCYERINRLKREKELSIDQFSSLVDLLLKKGIVQCTLTDGEPLLNNKSIEKCEIAVKKFWVTWIVTNGTQELPDFDVLYIVSLDGNKKIHDKLRGKGVYDKMKKNIKSSPTDCIVGTSTLNSINHNYITEIVESAMDLGLRAIAFNWYTPFSNNDPLWVDYQQRNRDIDLLIKLKEKYYDFIANTTEELEMMRNSGWTKRCPNWCTLSIDAYGKIKKPCVLGENVLCEKCGCHVFPSVLLTIEKLKGGMVAKYARLRWKNLLSGVVV